MAAKPKLYYFDGRGRMESVRWLLAAAGVEYEEVLFKTAEDFENLIKGGDLMYQQVPKVEMYMVQTRAILKYIAAKYNLYGKDLKERVLYSGSILQVIANIQSFSMKSLAKSLVAQMFPFCIDMYVEGMRDLNDMIMYFPFSLPEEKQKIFNYILERATQRFFPVYEKALKDHGKNYLVGNQFSWADVQLLEVILMFEELESGILSAFPKLQEFKARVSKLPSIQKFLQPGSARKPPEDKATLEVVKNIFKIDEDLFLQHMS